MTKQEKATWIMEKFDEHYPNPQIALNYSTPLELMIAVMLSAQCTDERVNKVTEKLFQKYTFPEDYLQVDQEEIEQDIFSTGFYKNKAKNLQGAVQLFVEKFDKKMPHTMEELLEFPGVARKTANVILGELYEIEIGIVVDTHMMRINHRLGLTQKKEAVGVEKELLPLIPEGKRKKYTHQVITHGRTLCMAKKPQCEGCFMKEKCNFYKN